MNWVLHQSIPANEFLSPTQLPIPPPMIETNLESKISPNILLIIVILAIIFFISGLLHLLVRYLFRPRNREPEELENATALQGQLQQLFHLHDSGVDQSFIETLPIFLYKAIIGLKDPFDCAVCLCEFEGDDKLRLLPKCSHAFHIECIDTWLLSHSTCPLCRNSLAPDFSPNHCSSPVLFVLESGNESSRETGSFRRGDFDANAHMGFLLEDDFGPSVTETSQKLGDIMTKEEMGSAVMDVLETKVVRVKLGKFRNTEVGVTVGEGRSCGYSNDLDQRRCLSMGSYEYVMDETSLLQVAIKPSKKKPNRFKKPGYAMSECDCHSRREGFQGFDSSKNSQFREVGGSARISSSKRESFSVSKIWFRSKKDCPVGEDCSRRAFSFRLPLHNESKRSSSSSQTTAVSEFEVNSGDLDVEVGSCTNNSVVSMGSQIEEAPSFARRTLMWIVGRQNKDESRV